MTEAGTRAHARGVTGKVSEEAFNGEETIIASSPFTRRGKRLEAHLIVIAHPQQRCLGRRYRLTPGAVLEVGRSVDAQVCFPEVPSISRRHARISYLADGVCLEDLGSRNGTYLKNHAVAGTERLQSGDRFQVGSVVFKFLLEEDAENAYHEAIYQMVMCDGLTDLFNRRKFQEELDREYARARRYGRPLSLIIFDVDHFKNINDTCGHLGGDAVLKGLARSVKSLTRQEEIVARVGGEEFAVLCPETHAAGARRLAEKLRAAFEAELFDYHGGSLAVTCSFGVGAADDAMHTSADLYAAADRALYRSKNEGRNRVSYDG